jgi:hypothetical protein
VSDWTPPPTGIVAHQAGIVKELNLVDRRWTYHADDVFRFEQANPLLRWVRGTS